jgi:site-specific DNA-methyltransferase (cytosine-N4-specific)
MGDTYGGSTTLGRNDAGRNFTGGGGNRPGSGNPGRQGEHERDIGLKPKDLVGMPWRVAFALQADGWWVRSDIIWSKPNPMPESVEDRPTKSHEYLFLLSKAARYYYDQEAIKEPQEEQERTRRIREQAQGLDTRYTIARDEHHVGQAPHGKDGVARSVAARHALALLGTRNRRTVWEIATEPFPEAHFATFPRALVEPCVKAGSREGDIVIDPFCGSGTAVLVAQELGRTGIGLDLKMEYLAMARKRTRQGVLL